MPQRPAPTTRPGRSRLYSDLTKIRLSSLVLVTAAVGFLLGAPEAPNWVDSFFTISTAALAGEWSRAGEVLAVIAGSVAWGEFAVLLIGVLLAWIVLPMVAAYLRFRIEADF